MRSQFNAAINDSPARPTIDEPGSVDAYHPVKNGGPVLRKPRMGWVDGQPGKGRG